MDDLVKGRLDFIKIDAEGYAYEILRGGVESLKTVLALKVEMEFNEKFVGQKLFSDVDLLLRKYKFQLFSLKPASWRRPGFLKAGGKDGQLIHGDFIYFLDPTLVIGLNKESIMKYCVLACVYQHYDLAHRMLAYLPDKYQQQLKPILTSASGFIPRLVRKLHK